MHPNVKKGTQIHTDHFDAIRQSQNGGLAPGWEIFLVNQQIGISGKRPDWIIINRDYKKAYVIDITARYNSLHYKKGLHYVAELRNILNDPSWEITYIEDYWLNATMH